jgi:hypothetical protein
VSGSEREFHLRAADEMGAKEWVKKLRDAVEEAKKK